ncbi:unnamed protein product [Ostreobium quekettii]|uniref:Uncharacterized protein n=1 Tax=Ostreobium quekettii TaxID=121088 RepID=A0A8S1J4P8_9CHLO|nr:unnamed protein product [Ostreobium quekettii]
MFMLATMQCKTDKECCTVPEGGKLGGELHAASIVHAKKGQGCVKCQLAAHLLGLIIWRERVQRLCCHVGVSMGFRWPLGTNRGELLTLSVELCCEPRAWQRCRAAAVITLAHCDMYINR